MVRGFRVIVLYGFLRRNIPSVNDNVGGQLKRKTNKWSWIALFTLITLGLLSQSQVVLEQSSFLKVYGEQGVAKQDVACLGKPLPESYEEFFEGEENRFGPNGQHYYCCQKVEYTNPLTKSVQLDGLGLVPYIDSGLVRIYGLTTKNITVETSKGKTIVEKKLWSENLKQVSLNEKDQSSYLVCGEKSNILETKKWGIQTYFDSTWYDLDPLYNPAGTSANHPNVSVGFSGQNSTNHILDNQTINMSANYTDYCSANICVANDSLLSAFRADQLTAPTVGLVTVTDTGGVIDTQSVFLNSTRHSNGNGAVTKSVNVTGSDTNFTSGSTGYGFGAWINATKSSDGSGTYYTITATTAGSETGRFWIYKAGNGLNCLFQNSTNGAIEISGGSKWINNEWHFMYCQFNGTHYCTYIDDSAPTACKVANTAEGVFSTALIWAWPQHPQRTAGNQPENASVDDFQIRNVALTSANITQLYYDGLHRLRPNDFSSNNSKCEWYLSNASGQFNVRNQTLGFNITTCTLNSTDTNQFLANNNVSANFTPVNNFENGLPRSAGGPIQIKSSDLNLAPTIQRLFPDDSTSAFYSSRPFNWTYNITDDVNTSLILLFKVNASVNVSMNYTNGTLQSTFLNLSRGTWRVCQNASDGVKSTELCIDFRVNNTPPNIQFLQPSNGTSILWNFQPFNWSWNASDADGDNSTLNIRLERNDTLELAIAQYNVSTNSTRNITLVSGAYQLCVNATDGYVDGDDSNESCIFFNVNNTRPNPTLILPTNNTQVLFSNRPYRFEVNVTDAENTTLTVRLMVNGSINETNTTYTQGTNFSFVLNFSRGAYTLAVNGTDGELNNQSGNFFFNVNNSFPTMAESMQDRGIYLTERFFRQVNCTDADGDTITFYNNHTNLFNITQTGIINYTPITGQNQTFSINISCGDGFGNTSSVFVLTVTNVFTINNLIGNTSGFEVANETWYLNTSHATQLLNVTGNFTFNNTRYLLVLDSTGNNTATSADQDNWTLWSANAIVPIVPVNNTNITFIFNYTITNRTQGVSLEQANFSYRVLTGISIISIAGDRGNITEGSDDLIINFSVSDQIDGATILGGRVEFNRTNFTAIKVQDSGTSANFSARIEAPLIDVLNLRIEAFAFFDAFLNGTTDTRGFATNVSTTVSQMSVTNCTTGDNTLYETLNVTVRDEAGADPIITAATWDSTFISYKRRPFNRTFSVVSRSNGSFHVCYRPIFDNISVDIEASISNSSFLTRHFFDNNFTLQNSTRAITVFLIANQTPNTNTVVITVNDQNDEPLIGRTVEVYLHDFNTKNNTFLTSRPTDFAGEVPFDLVTTDTYYVIVVKNGNVVELMTTPFISISPFNHVLRITLTQDRTLSNLLLLRGIPIDLSFNNQTRNWTMNWSDPQDKISTVCLNITNGTSGNLTWFSSCTTNDSTKFQFNIGENRSAYKAIATAVLRQDGREYVWKTANVDTTIGFVLLFEGIMMAFFIVGIMAFAGLYNPSASMLFGALGFLVMAYINFTSFPVAMTAITGISFLAAIFLSIRVRT